MDVAEKSPILDSEGMTIALAYDLRKAYEHQRKHKKIKLWDDQITIYGVEQIWPTFLVQIALLRTALGYIDSTRLHQSNIYLLESHLEDGLTVSHATGWQAYERLLDLQ